MTQFKDVAHLYIGCEMKRVDEHGKLEMTKQDEIKKYVSQKTGVPIYIIEGKDRKREYVVARMVAIYLMRLCTDLSLKSIGKQFGDRDHATIIHAIEKVEDGEPYFLHDWNEVNKIIQDGIDLFKRNSSHTIFKNNLKLIAEIRKLNHLSLLDAARVYKIG